MVWGLTVFPFQEGERCFGNGILPELVLLCRSRHVRRRLAGNELLQEWEALPAEGRWFFPRPVPAVPVCGKRARTEDGGCRGLSMEGFRCGECRAYNDDGTSRTQQGLPHEAVRQPLKKKWRTVLLMPCGGASSVRPAPAGPESPWRVPERRQFHSSVGGSVPGKERNHEHKAVQWRPPARR